MFGLLLKLFGVVLVSQLVTAWPSEADQCTLINKGRIQLVFVVDRTGTFQEFLERLHGIVEELTSKIVVEYPGSEFGLVYFSDYPSNTLPYHKARHDDITTGCYLLNQPLTNNTKRLLERTKEYTILDSGGSESSLAAVAFAATEKKMGWVLDDPNIHKILVLVTEEDYSNALFKPKNRVPFVGDGTDSCEKNLPPPIKLVGEILRNRSMSIIGLFTRYAIKNEDVSDVYKRYFEEMMIQYDIFQFNQKDVSKVSQNIIDGIKHNTRCEWADPPAYNTMGLNINYVKSKY